MLPPTPRHLTNLRRGHFVVVVLVIAVMSILTVIGQVSDWRDVKITTSDGTVLCGKPIGLVDGYFAPGVPDELPARCQEIGFKKFGWWIPIVVLMGFGLAGYLFWLGSSGLTQEPRWIVTFKSKRPECVIGSTGEPSKSMPALAH